jgi:hypothetical protein
MKHVLRIMTVALFAATVMAQAKPDFSGRWTIEPEAKTSEPASGHPRPAPAIWEAGWGTEPCYHPNSRPADSRVYVFFARGDMQPPFAICLYARRNGIEKLCHARTWHSRCKPRKTAWEGDKLIISTTHSLKTRRTASP